MLKGMINEAGTLRQGRFTGSLGTKEMEHLAGTVVRV